MTAAELRAWIKSRGLTRYEAAELLALTSNQLNKRLDGSNQVGAQTARIVELLEQGEATKS